MKVSPATRRHILVGLVSGLLVALLLWLGVLQRPEDFLYDLLLLARPAPSSGDVVIVGIDQKSLDALGRFPWLRSTHARLVEQLHRMGARLIALDLILSEPSPEDEELARAMETAGNVYLAVVRERRREETVYLEPAAPLAGAAAGLGHTHLALSGDGVVRSIPVMVGPYPSLSLLLAQAVRPVDPTDIPVGPGQRMPINFAPPDSIPVYSYADVLNGLVPEEAIAGKIVLVGFTASGLADQQAVPFTIQREPMYGVTVLAHALLTLLQGRFIRPVGLTHHPLFLIPALGIWGWLLGRWSSYRRILALVALSVGVLLLSFLLLRMGFYAPPLAILTGGWLVFLGIAYGESREIERLVSAHLRRLPVLLSPDVRGPATVPEEQLVSGVQALLEPVGVALIERTGRARYALKAQRGLPDAVPSRFRGTERDISSLDWWRRVGLGGWIQESQVTSVQAVPVSGGPEDCPMPGRRLPPRWLVIFRSNENLVYPDDNALLDALIAMVRLPACAADGQGTLKGEAGRLQTLMDIQSHLTYQLAILSTTGESISDGIVACDLMGRIYFCNRAMERVGIRPGDWLGRDFRLLMAQLGLVPLGEPLLTDLTRGKIPSWQKEIQISSAGQPTYWTVTLSRVLSDQGHPLGLVARFADITEMRELEKTRADTISFLAHEVRNPVAAIKGYAYLLRTVAENKEELARQIDHLADYVAQLVNDFLEVTKFEANRIPIRPQPLSLADAISNAWNVVEQKAREKDIRFSVRGARVTVLGDSRAMAQVLINLLDNAVKYSRPGGSVRVNVSQKDGFAFVDITDNGIGIPESELPRLFTKFFRASNARTERGTGLGLVMVKNLVEAQGGKIFVTTKEGAGSTFTFTVPLASSSAMAGEEDAS
jgi:PAS domain S-box-containing protein